MGGKNVHYHIRTNTTISHIVDYADNYDEMKEKRDKRIQMVKDLTGAEVENTTEYVTAFKNGATVKWQPCFTDTCNVNSTFKRMEKDAAKAG